VERQGQVRPIAQLEVAGIVTLGFQLLNLVNQHVGVNNGAVANNAKGVAIQHARRHQVELEDIIAMLDGMARIAATLAAHNHIGLGSEQIGDFRLSFIAPLGAYHHHIGHRVRSSRFWLRLIFRCSLTIYVNM